MNFYVVFCKNRKKFEKYIKVNRIEVCIPTHRDCAKTQSLLPFIT